MHEEARALLALWNDVEPGREAAYDEWHAVEHVPERLTVPGMAWGLRYADPSPPVQPHYLTLYGLRDAEVLDSEPYRRLLREPTPASAAMRPALKNVSRWVCDIVNAAGTLAGSDLAVWTSLPDEAAARGALAEAGRPDPPRGHLLGHRRRDASPLPWLAAQQDRPVEGDWLLCIALPVSGHHPPTGASFYRCRPVGDGHALHVGHATARANAVGRRT